MIWEFLDDGIMNYRIEVVFIDQQGEVEKGRGAGLLREALSVFWHEYFMSLSVGAEAKVPSIRHDYQKPIGEASQESLLLDSSKQTTFLFQCLLHFSPALSLGKNLMASQT